MKRWLSDRLPFLIVGVIPALLLSLGVARFITNHFFARAPFLLDSGLLSGVVYRSGLGLAPPPIACDYATSFYQVYFSPIISALSMLSYVVPVRRFEWFAVVQALVYLPIGFVVYALSSQISARRSLRDLALPLAAALAFSFSGIVIVMVSYPHYEAATPALICLVLAAVVTGRTRLTWIMIALAVSVRQDCGLHVALALAPLVYLKWRGTEMLPSQRRLLVTIAVAVGASLAGFACQRLLWSPVDRLTPVYFGSPHYAHLSWALISERVRDFGTDCQLIYYPFLATVLIAIVRRDARYLFGWAMTIPWFLFNFTAFDGAKAAFSAYTAGPFLVAMFWFYVYGARLAQPARRLSPGVAAALFAVICVSSTLGAYRGRPAITRTVWDMALLQPMDRESVHGFADTLLAHHADFGRVFVDDAVAALVQEGFGLAELWHGQDRPDALAFHTRSSGLSLLPALAANQLDTCVHATRTNLFVCSRAPLPAALFAGVEIQRVPAMFAFTRIARPGVFADDRGVQILTGFSLEGPLGELPRGHYTWTLQLEGTARAQIEIGAVVSSAGEPAISFETTGEVGIRYRVTATSPLVITGAALRRLATDPVAR